MTSDEEVTMTMTLLNENQRINVTFTYYSGLWLCLCMFVYTSSQSKMWQNVSFREGYFSLTLLAERNEAFESTALNSFTLEKNPIIMTDHHYVPGSRVCQVCRRQYHIQKSTHSPYTVHRNKLWSTFTLYNSRQGANVLVAIARPSLLLH